MEKFLKSVYAIVRVDEGGHGLSRLFDLTIMALVLLSVASVFAVTFDLSAPARLWLGRFEAFVSIVFTVEYLLRIATARYLYRDLSPFKATLKYMRSGMAIIDLLAILPFYLPMIFTSNLLALRVFRLLRILRLFKLNRYFDSLSAVGSVLKNKSRELIGSLFIVVLMLVISSLMIYTVEHDAQPEAFPNAFSGLWWAVATLTTVGYGDIYPVTVLGRIFGATIALLGIGMVAIPTGIISSGLVEHFDGRKSESVEKPNYCPCCGAKL